MPATDDRAVTALREAAPPSRLVKTAYGFGSVATGITETGFNYFLLIFYSQVMGLDARLVGLAVTISLIFDAVSDPVVGYWSDNLRSRWGRRHPFLYGAAIPVAVTYLLLWNPPADLGQQQLFWYLLLLSVLIRTLLTLFETPASAMAAELSTDYDERSSIMGFRLFFGWAGGNVMTVLMFFVIFPAAVTATINNGQFNRDAYALYGAIASAIILVSILVAAIGTHGRIAHFHVAPEKRELTLRRIFAEIRETLASRSFGALFAGSMLGAIATGLSASLAFYFTTYFWGFTPLQTGIIVTGVFLSAALGAMIAPWISRKWGKKRGAIVIGLVAFLGSPLPIFLRLIDVLPANGDPFIFWFILIANTIDTALIICFQILTYSMIADLVEQAELRTGRRSEALFFAAVSFVRKAVLGLGLVAASLVLTLAVFPTDAKQGAVPADALWRLGAYYVPTILVIWLAMIAVISTYRIGRGDHEDNLRQLAERKAASGDKSGVANNSSTN
jgi:Na+/melibiose symporter-like transporter